MAALDAGAGDGAEVTNFGDSWLRAVLGASWADAGKDDNSSDDKFLGAGTGSGVEVISSGDSWPRAVLGTSWADDSLGLDENSMHLAC